MLHFGISPLKLHYYGNVNQSFDLDVPDINAYVKKFEDVDLANNERLILVSPNGTRYKVTVDNSGNLGTATVGRLRVFQRRVALLPIMQEY